jgi:hypothetical protein
VVFSEYSGFLHWPPRYNWNIVECGVKHNKPKPLPIFWIDSLLQLVYWQLILVWERERSLSSEEQEKDGLGNCILIFSIAIFMPVLIGGGDIFCVKNILILFNLQGWFFFSYLTDFNYFRLKQKFWKLQDIVGTGKKWH